MNKFSKVSYEQFEKDMLETCNDGINKELFITEIERAYDKITLPKRATQFSGGYDFFSPFNFTLEVGKDIKIPTGIRVELDSDKFLAIYPRSSLGFKYYFRMSNSIPIIDSDYAYSNNEGHIFVKIRNESVNKTKTILQGEAFCQGIIQQYFVTDDDGL